MRIRRIAEESGIMTCILVTWAHSQIDTSSHLLRQGPHLPAFVSIFAPLFFPKVIQDGYQLKSFITSEEFARIRRSVGDVGAVDAIFTEALALSWDNTHEALLISFVATLDHRNFGVRLPLAGPLLWVPLTSEFPEDFNCRVSALPSQLYSDSPEHGGGDRDKLQHFFGSAFLAHICESAESAGRVGDLIESAEDLFVVDGALDERDRRANTQGVGFGLGLLTDKTIRPSEFLKLTTERHKKPWLSDGDAGGTGCIPRFCADLLSEDR